MPFLTLTLFIYLGWGLAKASLPSKLLLQWALKVTFLAQGNIYIYIHIHTYMYVYISLHITAIHTRETITEDTLLFGIVRENVGRYIDFMLQSIQYHFRGEVDIIVSCGTERAAVFVSMTMPSIWKRGSAVWSYHVFPTGLISTSLVHPVVKGLSHFKEVITSLVM